MNGKTKVLTIGGLGVTAATVIVTLAITWAFDKEWWIWKWDADAVHIQLAQDVQSNGVGLKKLQLDQAISERIQRDEAVRVCNSEPRTDCSQVRADQSWSQNNEILLRAEFDRMLNAGSN